MGSGAEADLYGVLGVPGDASAPEIRRAYRRLARQHHPDLNPHPDGPRRFAALVHAYEILNDPAQRARYDRCRRSPSPATRPRRSPDPPSRPVPADDPTIRRGILELSPYEASRLAQQPLVLRDARGRTIVLPTGTAHGDTITLLHDGRPAALTIWVQGKT